MPKFGRHAEFRTEIQATTHNHHRRRRFGVGQYIIVLCNVALWFASSWKFEPLCKLADTMISLSPDQSKYLRLTSIHWVMTASSCLNFTFNQLVRRHARPYSLFVSGVHVCMLQMLLLTMIPPICIYLLRLVGNVIRVDMRLPRASMVFAVARGAQR